MILANWALELHRPVKTGFTLWYVGGWWRECLSKSRLLKVFGNTKLQVAIENPCSKWVLKIPSSFQNKYDQLGDSSLCTPSGRYQSIYPIALKYMCPWLSLPDKASSWGAPNPGHLSVAGDLIFSQCLVSVFQPWLCVRIPLGLQMYTSPALPFRPPESNQDSGSAWGRDEKQGLGQSRFSRTSADYPVSPAPPFIPCPSFDWSMGNVSYWYPWTTDSKIHYYSSATRRILEGYTNCCPLWVMTWEK